MHFNSFLWSNGVQSLPLAKFKGNQLNILFYDAGALFSIAPIIIKILKDVWGTLNQLLRAVLVDIQVPEYLCACKALGLVIKLCTGPIWRLLQSGIPITRMSAYYWHMLQKFNEWSSDASGLLNGTERLFENVDVHNDRIMDVLKKPFEHDSTVQVIIILYYMQVLFSSFVAHCSHLLQDHLTDGQHSLVSDNQTLQKQTATVPSTNVISERDFAQFDRLLCTRKAKCIFDKPRKSNHVSQ